MPKRNTVLVIRDTTDGPWHVPSLNETAICGVRMGVHVSKQYVLTPNQMPANMCSRCVLLVSAFTGMCEAIDLLTRFMEGK